MQLRVVTGLTEREYVSGRAWQRASLAACPLHGQGCRGFSRHGTYVRKSAHGEAHVARWYCRRSRVTISLLPECFASGMPGSLSGLEDAVALGEAVPDAAEAARQAHPDPRVSRKAASRWLERRRNAVHGALRTLKGVFADQLLGCVPTVYGVRSHFGQEGILELLCILCAEQGLMVQAPLGVQVTKWSNAKEVRISLRSRQQSMGPDPPVLLRHRSTEISVSR